MRVSTCLYCVEFAGNSHPLAPSARVLKTNIRVNQNETKQKTPLNIVSQKLFNRTQTLSQKQHQFVITLDLNYYSSQFQASQNQNFWFNYKNWNW